jgi:tripartite-type tricarboxylate transporter receptor subunit TctC
MRWTLMLGLVLASCIGHASAQDYPTRAVKIIVPFGAGGPADVYARFVGQHLQEALKQSFVIENRPGAGSIIGTGEAAKSMPDGHTLIMMSNTHTVNETLIANKPFQLMRDFLAVAPVNAFDLVLVVHPSVAANNLSEFIALLRSKPGAFNYASSGPGTPYHMAGELFKAMTGTNIVHVPHKGSSEARNNVLGGHVHMMIDAITTMAPYIEAGRVRALGTTGKKRSTVLPALPTLAEADIPDYEAIAWVGLMAPKGTPQQVVERLNTEINKLLSRPEVKAAWAKQGAEPLIMSPSEFENFLHAEIVKWGEVVKRSNTKTN